MTSRRKKCRFYLKLLLGGIIASILLSVLTANAQTATIRWDTQLDRPVSKPLIIYRGETLDLLPRIVQGTDPVTITNTYLYFNYREPALAASNLYRQVAITTNTAPGTLQLTWSPSLDTGSATYEYEFVVGPDTNANPRVHGTITMKGTLGYPASTNPPTPVTLYATHSELTTLQTQITTNTSAISTLQSQVTTNTAAIQDVQALASASSSAIAILQTNHTTKLWSSTSPTNYIDGDCQVWHTISTPAYLVTNSPGINPSIVGEYFVQLPENEYGQIIYTNETYSAYILYWPDRSALQYYFAGSLEMLDNIEYSDPTPPSSITFTDQGITSVQLVLTNYISTNIVNTLAQKTYVDNLVAAIPLPPTNAVSGWLLYDTGSNVWLTVTISNLSFTVWEVQ